MALITVLNGPNLNMLGIREPEVYGKQTLDNIKDKLVSAATEKGHELDFVQSNAEHEIIEFIHNAYQRSVDFILINPGAFTHTSIAIRDAFLATRIPFIELHLSNVYSREPFRKHSYLSDIARGIVSGFGGLSYELALQAAIYALDEDTDDGH